jgi:(2Fe-2S) ferredoxin
MSSLATPFEKHVFVCTGGDFCPAQDGNSKEIHSALKSQAAKAGLAGKVRVNKSGCLDQCGHGPMIAVYPDCTWYSHITLDDVPVIVAEHLAGGRPVERLRFHPPKAGANKLARDATGHLVPGQTDGCRADRPATPGRDTHEHPGPDAA